MFQLNPNRHGGGFERATKLPNGIGSEKISADMKNGLLVAYIRKSAKDIQKKRKFRFTPAKGA
ncbi:Hsp20 family protein [Parasphingorhabdus sp.]|jgi:HSP20 family molecular chaperone IbpA|uniref:Hsp20 family protein n=1 Tax=Parasphingorhabdus sp. TaxID=2709688 RepID=UPI003FA6C2A0